MTTSMIPSRSSRFRTAPTISGGSAASSASRSSIVSMRSSGSRSGIAGRGSGATGDLPGSDGSGDERGVRDPSEKLLEQQGHHRDLAEAGIFETPVRRRFVGSHGRDHAVIRIPVGSWRARGDQAHPEVDEGARVGLLAGHDAQVMGLVLAGDADLDEGVETWLAGRLLDPRVDVRKPQDRRHRAPGNAPLAALALPVRDPEALEALDGGRRRGEVELVEPDRIDGLGLADSMLDLAILGPRLGQGRLGRPVHDALLAIAREPRLHEQLDVVVAIRTRRMKPRRAALLAFAQDLLDQPIADLTRTLAGRPDRVELHDGPVVLPALALGADEARDVTVELVDVQQVVRPEGHERQAEEAEDPDRRAADRQAERPRARALGLREPRQLAERGQVGEASGTYLPARPSRA